MFKENEKRATSSLICGPKDMVSRAFFCFSSFLVAIEAVVVPCVTVHTPIVFASKREVVTCRLSQDTRLQARGVFGFNDSITSKNVIRRQKKNIRRATLVVVEWYGQGGDVAIGVVLGVIEAGRK